MIHTLVLATVTATLAATLLAAWHYRRQSNSLTDEVIELRADLHEAWCAAAEAQQSHGQTIDDVVRMRRAGL
jgi:hypothetical protein